MMASRLPSVLAGSVARSAPKRDQQRIARRRKTTISTLETHGLSSGARLTAPSFAVPLAREPIVRLSDVHLDMASDAGMVNILRGVTLDIAVGEIAAVV